MREELGRVVNLVHFFRLRHAQIDLARFRGEAIARLDEFSANLEREDVPAPSVLAARRVVTAFLDETVRRSPWRYKSQWEEESLQRKYFRTEKLGEEVFDDFRRLGPEAPEAIEAFALCLAAGFRGKAGHDPSTWQRATQDAVRRLPYASGRMERPITPDAQPEEVFEYHVHRAAVPRWVMWLAGGSLAAALVATVYFANDVGKRIEPLIKAASKVDAPAPAPAPATASRR